MKYKIYKYLAGFICIAAVTASCVNDDDLLQTDPNVDSSGSFWKTEKDALEGVNAVYGCLIADGTYMRSTPLMLDTKSDDSRSNSPWGAMSNVGRFNSNVSDPAIYGWAYEMYYQGIYRANQVLTNVPKIDMADAALKNRILGQAYFLRGLYLFHAVNLFKNVPIPTEIALYNPQKSHEEGWAQVIADFKAASDLLPTTYAGISGIDTKDSQGNTIKGRATKGAALGYLAKAYLFTKDFANAKTTFKQVIDLGVYSLTANYRDNFTDSNENNSESLFEVQFSRDAGGTTESWGGVPNANWRKTTARAITYGARDFGFVDVQPTWALFNEFHDEKTTTGAIDPRLDATMFYNKPGGMQLYGVDFATKYANSPLDLNDIFCAKYENSDGAYPNEYDWRSGINERLLRYADILLMYAECLNETGDTQGAYTYIQMVRDRVGLPNLSTAKPGLSQAAMRDQIGHERFLEFALEGHRFDDIRRWGWLENPTKLAWLKARDAEFNSFSPGREYFPIPQLDMDNNPGMTQNPSY
ncbi:MULTISPECIES: RagB/SusD family nutrient uptake outer membrane protein [Flavobacterium]|jgi:tetratricopeptide (TPR) repeat protein|uniref:RagB/SusD family nutrient uptake outer membrane protein n=1 Tax=Flavobacterium TaxID=237 RepID=UPI002481F1A8|nr:MULTISPECIES: RagB/SusD family nutrient uptake outer membrane protein [Flavobacterium]